MLHTTTAGGNTAVVVRNAVLPSRPAVGVTGRRIAVHASWSRPGDAYRVAPRLAEHQGYRRIAPPTPYARRNARPRGPGRAVHRCLWPIPVITGRTWRNRAGEREAARIDRPCRRRSPSAVQPKRWAGLGTVSAWHHEAKRNVSLRSMLLRAPARKKRAVVSELPWLLRGLLFSSPWSTSGPRLRRCRHSRMPSGASLALPGRPYGATGRRPQ